MNADLAIHSGQKHQVLKAGRDSSPDCNPNNLLIDSGTKVYINWSEQSASPFHDVLQLLIWKCSCVFFCSTLVYTMETF